MSRNRKTRQAISLKLLEIRNLMLEGSTNSEIMAALDIPQRMFYRYMDKIYEQDKAELESKSKQSLATNMFLLRDRLNQTIKNCREIAVDTTVDAKDRIEAERTKIDASIALAPLEREGPTTMTQVNRQLQQQEQPQQPSLLSSPNQYINNSLTTTTTTTTTTEEEQD